MRVTVIVALGGCEQPRNRGPRTPASRGFSAVWRHPLQKRAESYRLYDSNLK